MNDPNLLLKKLRRQLPQLLDCINPGASKNLDTWCRVLDVKLLSRLGPEFPLVAAVCGGGSSGKSTLVNSLAGARVSPVGGTAGLNRRVLLVFHPRWLESEFFLAGLEDSLGVRIGRLEHPDQLRTPGRPLYAALESMPAGTVLLDTPDFDTGARGIYTNRQTARKWLEAADLLIYVFTNSNYANCDNTDFLSQVLTGIGTRPCLLVYRAYPGLENELVRRHAAQVGQNIFGRSSRKMVLGVFRADEDNAVADGKKPVSIRPVEPDQAGIRERLENIDVYAWRRRAAASALADILSHARQTATRAASELDLLDLYRKALEVLQSRCVTRALSHFPTDRVLRLFTSIWLQSDPAHVRIMRKTGNLVEWPLTTLSRTVKRLRGSGRRAFTGEDPDTERRQVENDLLQAADQLVRGVTAKTLVVEIPAASELERLTRKFSGAGKKPLQERDATGQNNPNKVQVKSGRSGDIKVRIELPACLAPWHREVAAIDRERLNRHLAAARDEILQPSEQLESELRKLAGDLRSRMGLLAQLRQTAAALLNVLPATAAVTYIISTGDPVGAAALKVKLTGLFGLHDLYALIAIPATSGLKKADRDQLRQVLEPVARSWLENRLKLVENLFFREITAKILPAADKIQREGRRLLEEVETILAELENERTP